MQHRKLRAHANGLPGTVGVSPAASQRIAASVAPNAAGGVAALTHPVTIHGISNVGVSLLVGARANAELESFEDLLLSLALPGKQQPSIIFCRVRHRAAQGEGTLYVCEYDWSATVDPLGVVEDLVGFMLDDNELNCDPPSARGHV